MWSSRYVLPFGLALTLALAALRTSEPEAPETIPARELVERAQRAGGASFTFSQATAAALAGAVVPRPGDGATYPELETALIAAGFRLRPVGSGERPTLLVERAGG